MSIINFVMPEAAQRLSGIYVSDHETGFRINTAVFSGMTGFQEQGA